MKELLENLVEKNRELTRKGKVADYIPALKEANSENLGICIIDMDEKVYTYGEYKTKFTIQSISKTIALMLAILDNGVEKVFEKVGMEPTGDDFNSMYRLETENVSKPLNPMINAGAIAVTSLIKGSSAKEKFERFLNFSRKIICNDRLNLNREVYISEKKTGNKNRAIAYLLKDMGILEGNVEEVLEVYFKQCSIEVDCMDMAKLGLFLSNGGKLTETRETIINDNVVRIIKTLMLTCGMYNSSGEFAIKVGIPAKSGVSGGIMASVPNRMGIGIYGPSLDGKGNSLAGNKLLEDLSKSLSLSIF